MPKNTILVLSTVLFLFQAGLAQSVEHLNKARPGEVFEHKPYLSRGQLNVVVFFSSKSEASLAFLRELDRRAANDRELNLKLLDIDRPGKSKIDWTSPLARSERLYSLPHVLIYQGKQLEVTGARARSYLLKRYD